MTATSSSSTDHNKESRLKKALHRARLSSRRSRRRLTFLSGGVAVGGIAVGFAILADESQAIFRSLIAQWPLLPLILTPAVFLVAAYLTQRFAPNAKGSGIPQTIASRKVRGTKLSRDLISIRVAAGKILLTLLGLMSGASIGREGPTVQIGAAIMSKVGFMTRIQRSGLILAGACAGVAAAFNTPLAGIVFGIEEMSQSSDRRPSGLTLVTVVAAGLTALALVGNYSYFGNSHALLPNIADWYIVPVCGAIGGLCGGLFSRIVILFSRGLPGAAGRFVARRPLVFSALCGLGVAVCGLASGGATFGTGYEQARGLIDHSLEITGLFSVAKIIATVLSTISGIPGGIFSPSLAIGVGIGSNVALLFPHVDPGILFLIGMVAYLTGVVQAPITAVVIVTEMADAHAMIIPLMAAAIIAQTASRAVCSRGIYHVLSDEFLRPRPSGPEAPGGDKQKES